MGLEFCKAVEVFNRGMFLQAGFAGVVRIEQCKYDKTQKKGDAYTVEATVVEGNGVKDAEGREIHPNGSRVTWMQFTAYEAAAGKELNKFIIAVLGKNLDEQADQDFIKKNIYGKEHTILEAASIVTKYAPKGENAFRGRLVHVRATPSNKKLEDGKKAFPTIVWSPAPEQK